MEITVLFKDRPHFKLQAKTILAVEASSGALIVNFAGDGKRAEAAWPKGTWIEYTITEDGGLNDPA